MLNWLKNSQNNGVIKIPNEGRNFQQVNNTNKNEWLNFPFLTNEQNENGEVLSQTNKDRRIFSQNSKRTKLSDNDQIVTSPSRQLNSIIIKNMRSNGIHYSKYIIQIFKKKIIGKYNFYLDNEDGRKTFKQNQRSPQKAKDSSNLLGSNNYAQVSKII